MANISFSPASRMSALPHPGIHAAPADRLPDDVAGRFQVQHILNGHPTRLTYEIEFLRRLEIDEFRES
jgi:hypothetical protein